tara:strand:- start:2427 stop:2654 length:228 start_codon:yes stop_codon:yes gene_type:complete
MSGTGIGKMTKGQLRMYIEKVLREGEIAIFNSNIELGSGFLNSIVISDGVTVTITENETVTILPSEIMTTRRSTT